MENLESYRNSENWRAVTHSANQESNIVEDTTELDLGVYFFDSHSDLTEGNGRYVGDYHSYSYTDLGTNSIWVTEDGAEDPKRIPLKNIWGFKIDGYIFRMGDNPKMPLTIIKVKDKVFYVDGYLYLNFLQGESMTSTKESDAIFYSDELNTEIYGIVKIIRNEKDNDELSGFCDCIEKGKNRSGYQAQFNGYMKCIDEH